MSSNRLTKILAVVLTVIVAGYIIISFAKSVSNSYKTQTAYVQSVSETIDAKMFIIREESVIYTEKSGVMVPLAVNGERVGAGNDLAAVFADETSAANYAKAITLKRRLEMYQKIESSVKLANLDLKKLSEDINGGFYSILNSVYGNDFSSISEKELSFGEMLARKDISFGREVDAGTAVAALESEIAALKVKQPKEIVSAESAGCFVSRLDGYEGIIDAADIDSLTPEQLTGALESEKKEQDDNVFGKLITGFEWYCAAIVDTAQLAGVEVGKNVTLVLGDKAGDTVRAKVYAKTGVEGENKTMAVFKCSDMNNDIATSRKITGKIVTRSYTGIKIKKSAVRFNDKGEEGVYILEGNIVKFNLINEVFADGDYVVASDNRGKPGMLSQYDEIIISGKDLYNGKVIT